MDAGNLGGSTMATRLDQVRVEPYPDDFVPKMQQLLAILGDLHQMKAGVDAPEPALEQGGEGSGVASGSGVAGFFSAPVGRWAASHRPVDTAQNSANAMTRMRRSSRPGSLIWLSSSPKPRLLKSENRASMPQRRP